MSHFVITNEFETDPAGYWKLFFHEPFNVALYERIGVKERKRLSFDETEATIKFSVRILPKRDLPGFMKKLVGGDFGYIETSTLVKAEHRMDVRIEPTLLKDRITSGGLFTVTPVGEHRIRRTFEGDIKVAIPLVGGKVEGTIVDDVKRSYEVAAQVTAEWLKRGGY